MRKESKEKMANKRNGAVNGAKKKGKNVKNKKHFKFFRLLIVIAIIVLIFNIINNKSNKRYENVKLVIGDKDIELVHNIEVDKNGNIYLSIDDIKNLYDSNVYYSNNILITTYNKHIAVLENGKTTMKVNDVVIETKGTLKEINNIMYLPFSDMEDVYDFSKAYNKDTNVLSLDSKCKEKKEAIVLKNTSLKNEPKKLSSTIENVKKTQYVTVFNQDGDYTKVRTLAGNVGYILTKKITEPEVKWETMDDEQLKGVTVLKDYAIVSSDYEVSNTTSENTIVIPNLFSIVESSDDNVEVKNIIDLEGAKFKSYKTWADESNINVCPSVTLDCSMSKVCNTYESRSYVINTLYNLLINNKLNMICIEFEEVDDVEGLYRFLSEIMPRFKCAGMKVLIKNNSTLNKERLKNIVDYIVD